MALLSIRCFSFLPAIPGRKAGRSIAPAADRLGMVRLAVADGRGFEVCTLELEGSGPSYTADTLASLAGQHPGAELFLILGQDALADLPHWYMPQRIIELALLAVARRPGYGQPATEAIEERVAGISSQRMRWLEIPAVDISATDIRRRVGSGRSIRDLVADPVEEYIRRKGLYKT